MPCVGTVHPADPAPNQRQTSTVFILDQARACVQVCLGMISQCRKVPGTKKLPMARRPKLAPGSNTCYVGTAHRIERGQDDRDMLPF
eukprot:2644051-Rhodomonas_salina.2